MLVVMFDKGAVEYTAPFFVCAGRDSEFGFIARAFKVTFSSI